MTTAQAILTVAASTNPGLSIKWMTRMLSSTGILEKRSTYDFLKDLCLPPRVWLPILANLSMGLMQAPRPWFEKFRDAFLHLDFHLSPYDPSKFLHRTSTGIAVLLVYVDDIIIIGTNIAMIHQLHASLHQSFHVKDLGALTNILGPEVYQSTQGIALNQHKYALI